MALTSSSLLLKSGEFGCNVANAMQHQATNQQQLNEQGIFDRLEKKINEKEQAMAEFEVTHQQNLVKAQQQALLIASGQMDGSIGGASSIDDQIAEDFNKIDQTSIKRLAGMKDKSSKEKQNSAQILGQQAGKKQKQEEEEEPRDDFEGFGSITAMVQNKDKLVEKTLADDQFQAELEQKKQEEQAAKDRAKKEKEDKEKAAQAAKKKEQQAKVAKLTGAKAKLQALLDKSVKKAKPHQSISDRLKKMEHQQQVSTPAATPVASPAASLAVVEAPVEPVLAAPSIPALALTPPPISAPSGDAVSQSAYQKAIQSVLQKPKPSVTQTTRIEPQVIASLSTSTAGDSEEPTGFIGKYSKKISDQEMTSAKMAEEMEQESMAQKAIKIPLSKSAPKHKGMLARAMEKDMMEQEKKEEQEKDALMQAAINDPTFQSQVNNLQVRQTPALAGYI